MIKGFCPSCSLEISKKDVCGVENFKYECLECDKSFFCFEVEFKEVEK